MLISRDIANDRSYKVKLYVQNCATSEHELRWNEEEKMFCNLDMSEVAMRMKNAFLRAQSARLYKWSGVPCWCVGGS